MYEYISNEYPDIIYNVIEKKDNNYLVYGSILAKFVNSDRLYKRTS
jgi:hypothetical protein